jgi:flagellar hook-associated protein 3 FlgL
MASQIAQIQKRLVDLGNTRGTGGQYIFAGQMSTTKPFDATSGTLTFSGDNNDISVETSAAETTVVSTPGEQLFTQAFQALDQFRTNLLNGTVGAPDSDINALQGRMKEFRAKWGEVGGTLQRVDEIGQHHTRRVDELTKQISDVVEVDMAEAITKYQQAETAYTAALQVGSQGYKLSLMDFIR